MKAREASLRCTAAELEQKKWFDAVYERAVTPTMLAIERCVCGGDYGGNSWLTREQVDDLAIRLALSSSKRLLDLGAGSGWPALYLVRTTGCEAMLVDLPEIGLRIAKERAVKDGIADRVSTLIADAAQLPFEADSFDAVSHCDLLCCLERKREALESCRRVVRENGRMAFTVISIPAGLSKADYRRSLETSPSFVETETDYLTLLRETGWPDFERVDITQEYEASCMRQIAADLENEEALVALIGRAAFEERVQVWRAKLKSIRDGLAVRDLFVATPGR